MRLIPVLLLAVFGASASADEVYRWVDEKGRVHYSDQTRRPAEKIRVHPDSGSNPDVAALQGAEARRAECERKRAQLEGYRKAQAIKETDALGRTREYSAQEREMLIERTAAEADQLCSGIPQAAAPVSTAAEEPEEALDDEAPEPAEPEEAEVPEPEPEE